MKNIVEDNSNSRRRRIAIVGSDVSGLSAAYFLEEATDFEVTLYERLDRLGGNALTVGGKTPDGKPFTVDPIAYLFVKQRYPYFTKWLHQLDNDASLMPVDKRHWSTYCYRYVPGLKSVMGTIWSGQSGNKDIFTTYDWSLDKDGVNDATIAGNVKKPVHCINYHVRTPMRTGLYEARGYVNEQQERNGLRLTGCFMRETGFHEDGLATTIDPMKMIAPEHEKPPRLKRLLDAVRGPYGQK